MTLDALLYSPHSFRVTTITDLLEQNVPREDVQHLAGHADPRTTNLYDRGSARSKGILSRGFRCSAARKLEDLLACH